MFDGRLCRDEHFAAHMPAFFLGRQLIFKVNTCRASLDHGFHQLENVQRASETSLCIGHDRSEPVGVSFALGSLNLVGTLKGLVDAAYNMGNAIGRIEALIGIHLPGKVGVSGNLPAAEINGFQASFYLLDGLVAGESTEGGYICFTM